MTNTAPQLPRQLTDLSEAEPPIALGPLDGRYRAVAKPLVNYLSEAALNRARVIVEVEWMIFLLEQGVFPQAPQIREDEKDYLRAIIPSFDADSVAELAASEAVTKHDVKAVEYLLKARLESAREALGGNTSLPDLHELVHIFCTSEDINNLAYALVIRDAIGEVWLPAARQLVDDLAKLAQQNRGTAMLALTHGQPATPVTLGKEIAVFVHRLTRQLRRIEKQEYLGKINGATGTWAAHRVACPQVDWPALSQRFVEGLGLTWNPLTTQIESHDWQAELYADLARFNRIAHNLATDFWSYISLGYFRQRLSAQGSTGSSTMPHKVNPIRFENAEANLEVSCALLDCLAATLVTSRMQRDLTDSTTQRNIGVALGHSLLALDNLRRGLAGLDVDSQKMASVLDANWEVLGEAIQQIMRVAAISGIEGVEDPYERLRDLTRGKSVDSAQIQQFVKTLGLPADEVSKLQNLKPITYIGYSSELTDRLETEY